jgi:hypothetical protein
MLIVYSKTTGRIKGLYSGGLQTFNSVFGDEAVDYALIWDSITMPDDKAVINNPFNYIVNIKTRQLEILPSAVSNYPVANIIL